MKRIEQIQNAAVKAELPEMTGHHHTSLFFRGDPLKEKARAEKKIADKPDNRPNEAAGVKPGNGRSEPRFQKMSIKSHASKLVQEIPVPEINLRLPFFTYNLCAPVFPLLHPRPED